MSSLANSKDGVTRGDGTDSPNFLGILDYQLCEFELPPLPPGDVFDARWTIPLRNGSLRNIYPNGLGAFIYKARFQAGGENGQTSVFYPVTISWKPTEVPAVDDAIANPNGYRWVLQDFSSQGNYFSFNMNNPSVDFVKKNDVISGFSTSDPSRFEVVINNADLEAFVIMEPGVGVENNDGINNGISMVSPNPVVNNSTITYGVAIASDVKLEVVDVLGNVVASLVNEYQNVGTYTINWSGNDQTGRALVAGTYTLRLVAGNESSTKPVVIVR